MQAANTLSRCYGEPLFGIDGMFAWFLYVVGYTEIPTLVSVSLVYTMTVNLKPGAYIAVCTIFNGFHIASGMVKPFAVGKIGQNGKWGP